MLAHFYNSSSRAGREVVMTYKDTDFATGSGLVDIEAGQLTEKASFVWQTDDVMDWGLLVLPQPAQLQVSGPHPPSVDRRRLQEWQPAS